MKSDIVSNHFGQIGEAMSMMDLETIRLAEETLRVCRSKDGQVWLAGNGGSAATASHFANDLMKMCHIPAFNLADMTPAVTAYGNDNGWNRMFSDVLRSVVRPGDVFIALTCSGASVNVVRALEIPTPVRILITGPVMDSPALMTNPNVIIQAIAQEITVMEDMHSIICHSIARALMKK